MIRVEVDRGEIADNLVDLGLLPEWDSENIEAIQLALKAALTMLRRYE
jgi:hypothetical protein